ncbi:hypothetical protein ACFV6F_17740 [Kitasatospora phosalacinea]|uniref:hypothetical protein n=1 Tax=Kitasatospora phosalacinea TaxID=2065 RepID=UPI003652D5EB
MEKQTGPGAVRQEKSGSGFRFRTGDVLTLECPFFETLVTSTGRFHISVRWPWKEPEPSAERICGNGDFALPTPDSHEWERLYFRTEPTSDELRAGDTCRVGILPTLVHVVAVHHFDPPLVTGTLPRPATYLEVLERGESHAPDFEDQGFTFDPADGAPIRLELRFRPYAFLEPGDEVTDRHERVWRFEGPWSWHSFDGGRPHTPTWPLKLLCRNGEPTNNQTETEAVALATATGSHAEELGRWTELTCAVPSGTGSLTE